MTVTTVNDVALILESFSPIALQEDYDNCGLQVGNPGMAVSGILITLDVTIEVLKEAVLNNCNLIVSHHPVTLTGIKKITSESTAGQVFLEAAHRQIAVYAAHTNIDSVKDGVSGMLAKKLGLIKCKVLEPRGNLLLKLVTFVPPANLDMVSAAMFDAGAGHIGNYDWCSFSSGGLGTFRGDETTNPSVGEPGKLQVENELRVEVILPAYRQNDVVNALLEAHPYEEPAYDLYPLKNNWNQAGFGVLGELPVSLSPGEFLGKLKSITRSGCIRYTATAKNKVQKIAVCGGSGSFLIKKAIGAGADVLVSGDFKYHQFFETTGNMMIADIGHHESEQFTKELFFEVLTKKLPNFAIRLSSVNTNPVKYY